MILQEITKIPLTELRQKEENLTRTLDEKNEQLSSVKHELQLRERLLSDKERAFQIKKVRWKFRFYP